MIKAIGVQIIVEKDPRGETMEKGIIIPESAERTPRFGPTVKATVISVGARCRELRAGMRVALKSVAGDDITRDGRKFTRLREKDIVGILS